MSDELTDLEVRILTALREHKDSDSSRLFSMKEFHKQNLSVKIPWNRLKEVAILLEDEDYIRKFRDSGTFDDPFGSYEIASKGLRYLRDLAQMKNKIVYCLA